MPPNNIATRLLTGTHSFWYQVSGGVIGGSFFGAPILLLTHTGRKSGRKHTTPLIYLKDGADHAIVASYGGSDKHPTWFLNLRDRPDAEIQVGREKARVRAEVASDADRERLWPQLVGMYKDYAEYQKRTSRKIPVVILHVAG